MQYFLDQCLHSIFNNPGSLNIEVIVVDNASEDNSVTLIRAKYPQVRVIVNEKNIGFSRANNIGIEAASGEYILILNPDTILSSDTLRLCYSFMQEHKDAGAVCVRMIDGSGKFLPESKRGNPTFRASFMKMTGLYRLFPHSKWFNSYYFGHIGELETSKIEVMTGAFMFIKRSTLDQAGYFDEDFFMYGEDIDLSYRLRETGKATYYLPTTSIVHFKGESTKKETLEYIRNFYEAMAIFVRKHYAHKGWFYIFFLQVAVYFRSFLKLGQNIVRFLLPKLIDTLLIIIMLAWLRIFWGNFYFGNPDYIGKGFLWINLPVYTSLWIISAILNGKYRQNRSIFSIIKSVFYGTLAILIVYALFSQDYRNSRTIIMAGTLGTFLIFICTSILENLLLHKSFSIRYKRVSRYIIAGSESVTERIKAVLAGDRQFVFAGRLNTDNNDSGGIGQIEDLASIVSAYKIDEVIFSQSDIPTSTMIKLMSQNHNEIDFRMVMDDAASILSSKSKNKPGELYAIDINYNLSIKSNRTNKRLFDISMALFLMLLSPLLYIIFGFRLGFIKSAFNVLNGSKTLISYIPHLNNAQLPSLAPGVLNCSYGTDPWISNLTYARNYTVWEDITYLVKNFKDLGSSGT